MVPFRSRRPPPRLPRRRPALHSLTQGRAAGSWTGCCQRRDPSTDALSTPSSERGSSRDFLPDTRSTGGKWLHLCVLLCVFKVKKAEGEKKGKRECLCVVVILTGVRKTVVFFSNTKSSRLVK